MKLVVTIDNDNLINEHEFIVSWLIPQKWSLQIYLITFQQSWLDVPFKRNFFGNKGQSDVQLYKAWTQTIDTKFWDFVEKLWYLQ